MPSPSDTVAGHVDNEPKSSPVPDPPPLIAPRLLWEWLRAVVAFSGILLVASYLTGRVYLESYFREFNLTFGDLALPIQEVSFQWLQAAFFAALLLAYFLSEEARKGLLPLWHWLAIWRESEEKVLRWGPIKLNWPQILPIIMLGIPVLFAAVDLVFTELTSELSPLNTAESIKYPFLMATAFASFFLIAHVIAAQNARDLLVKLLVFGGWILFSAAVLGRVNGTIDSYDLNPKKSSLVVLRSSERLGSDWIDEDGHYVSPVLRLVTRTNDSVITWDPEERKSTFFPIDRISSVTKGADR